MILNIKETIDDDNIKCVYDKTKYKDPSKWQYIKKFVILTKDMKFIDIAKLIGKKNEGSFRKEYDAFKRIEMFLSYLDSNDYAKLELPNSYFQKVKWNDVLSYIRSSTTI